MDIIECLSDGHGKLRGSLATLTTLLGCPHEAGWDDCVKLDQDRFTRELDDFISVFRAHESMEDAYLMRVLEQVGVSPEISAALAEGHRVVAEITKLFGAVAFSSDGVHVYRLRIVLSRLCDELEAHMSYEEKVIFPMLRERLPDGLLRELGRRAQALTH